MADGTETLVVGAGIVGLTTALLLAEAGRRVVVITAEPVGGGSSGRSAGVVSQLHGTAYRRMAAETAHRNAAAYRAANAAGFALIEDFAARRGIPVDRRDALLVALERGGASRIDDEHLAAQRAGLRVVKERDPDLPFRTFGALRLRDQLLLDPRVLLRELARAAQGLGVEIVEGERVIGLDVRPLGGSRVRTAVAERSAHDVVLATGTPILDRGLYALKTQAFRILALHGTGVDPGLPLLTALGATGSTTIASAPDGGTTVIGGAHPVGVDGPETRFAAALERFATAHLEGFAEDARWSGQDYRPFNPIAFVGALPGGGGRVRFATGFDGWGLTHGAAAAIRIAAEILGTSQPAWARTIGRRVTRPASGAIGLSADAQAAARLVRGAHRLTPADRRLLGEGQGVVHRTDRGLVATSRVGGVVRSVSGRCTRLGGALTWNDLERSWDCPVCGSRFAPDGAVLEGGARGPLPVVADPADWGSASSG
ncbi:FAD-dependent oxidoreductase [Amnibacterium sp. CER49]|uniref:FAD-dependent oxidoreductase n=1 Tax=Amnibacterium sp. CER49 TaxID=3039161 RepID=UPI002447E79B|nr:FAD-dependent oxidoreductase [Amnibacterium sp. CER49]MDH2445055.1 FAD-dependent oxidoreductase [Amnibacterium sp. CER49]